MEENFRSLFFFFFIIALEYVFSAVHSLSHFYLGFHFVLPHSDPGKQFDGIMNNCTSWCKDAVGLAGVLKVVVQCHPVVSCSTVEAVLCQT